LIVCYIKLRTHLSSGGFCGTEEINELCLSPGLDALGWTAQTALRDGIQQTYDWYREQEALNVQR